MGSKVADTAGAADATQPAEEQNIKMAANSNDGLFSMADSDCLKRIQEDGLQKLNMLINNHRGNFYEVPEKILATTETDVYNNKQDSKERIAQKRGSAIAVALGELSQHMLGFLVPGQVLMIQKGDNVENMLKNDVSELKKDVKAILEKMTYYKVDHEQMKRVAEREVEINKSNQRLLGEALGELTEAKEEIKKLRNDIFLRKQTGRTGADHVQEQLPTQNNRNNSQGRGGRGGGGRGRYIGPNGSGGAPDPTQIPHIVGGGADFDENSSSNKHFKKPEKEPSMFDPGAFENDLGYEENENQNFQNQRKGRKRKPETVPLSKKEVRFAKEIIVHRVPSLKKEDFDTIKDYRKKEAEVIFQLFEELSPKWLQNYGVTIDIEKDIDWHDRLDKHYESKTYGEAPIRIKFNTIQKCDQVKRAAKRAECLNGRRESYYGKFAKPKEFDSEGNLNDNVEEDAKNKADLRPKLFFRPSIPREERDKKKEEKLERDKEKNHSENKAWRKEIEEKRENRVFYGSQRNFAKGTADEISAEGKADREKKLAEIATKKALKEKERREKLKVTNESFPNISPKKIRSGPGSRTALGNLSSIAVLASAVKSPKISGNASNISYENVIHHEKDD